MSTTTTRQLREPFVETAGIGLTEAALPYLKKAIPTESYTGQQFVASLSPVEQEAIAARGGLGAYQPYLSQAGQLGTSAQQSLGGVSPYQQQLEAAGTTLGGVAPYQQQLEAARTTLGGVAPYQQQLQAAGTTLGGATQYIGPQAYQPFMSPYQQEVIDTSLAALKREQAKGLGELRQRAIQAGAFGGGREGLATGEYQATSDIGRAQLEAQLRQQGFSQAQQQAAQAFNQQQALAQEQARQAGQGFTQQLGLGQAYQGLGQFQSQLGQTGSQLAQQQITGLGQLGNLQRQLSQAQLAAEQEKAREAAFEPFTRLGLIGPQLASVIGGFPAATQLQTTPPPSTTQQLLGLGIGAAGLGGAIKSFF